jgi:fucose permease
VDKECVTVSAWQTMTQEGQMTIHLRRAVVVLGRIIISVFVGVALSTLVWTTNFLVQGQLIEALKGNVEDAHGLFWGLFNLGTFAGIVVGAAWSALRQTHVDKTETPSPKAGDD